MEIRTLAKVSTAELTKTFNTSFQDYIISFQLTESQVMQRLKTTNINLDLSPGAFIDNRLVGFVWHGVGQRNGKPVIWNGGTGVIPTQRGQGITSRLYSYILPKLRMAGYSQTVLEVIIGNDPAIHTYQKQGFKIIRSLDCFKGQVSSTTGFQGVNQRILKTPLDWDQLRLLRSWMPTFQNDDFRINALGNDVQGIEVYAQEELVAYILCDPDPEQGSIFQFAVKATHRRHGIGRALFTAVQATKTVPLSVVNVDASHAPSISFFEALGLQRTVRQYEMIKEL